MNLAQQFGPLLKVSLAQALPGRRIERGLQDWDALGDAALRQGVVAAITKGLGDFSGVVGRENELGSLSFGLVGYLRASDKATPEDLEDLELALCAELEAWAQAAKPEPLDAVYVQNVTFSQGLSHPYGYVVMELKALYI